MPIIAIDHVQLAMPPGREADARAFYADLLGIPEAQKPPNLAPRGGCWFARGSLKVHQAHPAFLVEDLRALVEKITASGFQVRTDEPLAGYDRVYVDDPFGNRIELLEPLA